MCIKPNVGIKFRACAFVVFRAPTEGVVAAGGLSGASGTQAHGRLSVDGGVVPQRPGGRPLRAAGTTGNVSKKQEKCSIVLLLLYVRVDRKEFSCHY